MPRGRAKRGLRVIHCDNVMKFTYRGIRSTAEATKPEGFYIHVWYGNRWYALMDLRFKREKDALRAAQALTAAGLDSHGAMSRADPMTVKRIATECLQW